MSANVRNEVYNKYATKFDQKKGMMVPVENTEACLKVIYAGAKKKENNPKYQLYSTINDIYLIAWELDIDKVVKMAEKLFS